MKSRLLAPLVLCALFCVCASADLKSYVDRPDDSYRYEVIDSQMVGKVSVEVVRLESQTWQGIPWRHWLAVFRPEEVTHPGQALMLIAGGNNRENPPSLNGQETQIIAGIASSTKSVTAVLSQVPNQPLFDGLTEDKIIALTYDKFLRGEGDDWPLLFPMVKSAIRAMDTVHAVMKEKHDQEISEFMLTGASKRGWTTWLTATADPRVKAIAPIVIDMLNAPEQAPHQLASYGGFSEEVSEYTELKIQERMDSEQGRALSAMVDPYAYRDTLTLPKLIVLGANDPYWCVDSANLYFPGLKGEKHLCYQANTEHDVSLFGIGSITQFYDSFLKGEAYPAINWKIGKNAIEVSWEKAGGTALLWQATSSNRDFREATWTSTALEGETQAAAELSAPASGWTAGYIEVRFQPEGGLPFGSTTQMLVLPETFPESDRAYDPIVPAVLSTETK